MYDSISDKMNLKPSAIYTLLQKIINHVVELLHQGKHEAPPHYIPSYWLQAAWQTSSTSKINQKSVDSIMRTNTGDVNPEKINCPHSAILPKNNSF